MKKKKRFGLVDQFTRRLFSPSDNYIPISSEPLGKFNQTKHTLFQDEFVEMKGQSNLVISLPNER